NAGRAPGRDGVLRTLSSPGAEYSRRRRPTRCGRAPLLIRPTVVHYTASAPPRQFIRSFRTQPRGLPMSRSVPAVGRAPFLLARATAASAPAAPPPQVGPAGAADPARVLNAPLVSGIFTADPSAHLFHGRVCTYPSHDIHAGVPADDLGSHFAMR